MNLNNKHYEKAICSIDVINICIGGVCCGWEPCDEAGHFKEAQNEKGHYEEGYLKEAT